MPEVIGYPPMKDHNAHKHSEMKNGANPYIKPPKADQQSSNMSSSKAVLGAPGSDVMKGRGTSMKSGNPHTNSGGGGGGYGSY